jgi:hypothetical protein
MAGGSLRVGTPASSTTKTGRYDIAEIWLKVALSTINQIKSICLADLLPVKTLNATTKFMICYWLERCMLRPSL